MGATGSKLPAVTLHASPEFSREHLHRELNAAGDLMLEAAAQFIQPANVLSRKVHRWLYSLAYERYPEPFWQADGMPFPMLFGGDGFGIGNVEGAYL